MRYNAIATNAALDASDLCYNSFGVRYLFFILVLDGNSNGIIRAVYVKNKSRMLSVAKSYLGDRAEDAVHDVFIKLAEKFENNMEELCDKEAYYFVTIVKNHSTDIVRRDNHLQPFDFDEDESVLIDEKSPESIVVSKDEREQILNLIDRLKPDYREALEYKYLLDYSNQEIAQELNVSPSVVSTRINRARTELKRLMEKEALP